MLSAANSDSRLARASSEERARLILSGLTLALVVLILDQGVDVGAGQLRPGFGEESCWFTSCTRALAIFLYAPISAMLLTNLALFVFAAVKLYQMQRNIRESRRRSGFSSGTQSVKRMVSAEEESENVKRRFIRQISTVSQRFSSKKSRPSYDALKEK